MEYAVFVFPAVTLVILLVEAIKRVFGVQDSRTIIVLALCLGVVLMVITVMTVDRCQETFRKTIRAQHHWPTACKACWHIP